MIQQQPGSQNKSWLGKGERRDGWWTEGRCFAKILQEFHFPKESFFVSVHVCFLTTLWNIMDHHGIVRGVKMLFFPSWWCFFPSGSVNSQQWRKFLAKWKLTKIPATGVYRYIYLCLDDFYGTCRWIYLTWILWVSVYRVAFIKAFMDFHKATSKFCSAAQALHEWYTQCHHRGTWCHRWCPWKISQHQCHPPNK